MDLPDGISAEVGHIGSAGALARAAAEALRADDPASAAAFTGLAQVHATLALAETQQQLLWVVGDLRDHLELLRVDGMGEISRALRERPA
ncbi:hypothetical protein ACFT8P_28450 [Streptomyces sp. NPDC057101]|uniref:hypothetical protein n=1 Tax=Streptomyces sp. NPDC057101 TaxID=3346020 RepID=UPI003641FEFC